MELRQFFIDVQDGKLTREQKVLSDEFRVIIHAKTEMALSDLMEAGLLEASEDREYWMAGYEIAAFFISWMEMIIFSGLVLPSDRMRELEILLLTVRLTFCLSMKKELEGAKSAEYWMDKMVGRCRQYWARIDLKDPGSRAKTIRVLLENLAPYLIKSGELKCLVYAGLEDKVRNLVDLVNVRLSRHGFKRLPSGRFFL